MARYTAQEALEMICDEFHSGGELDIEEDLRFPLPHLSDEDDERDPSPSPPLSPSPSWSPSLSPSLSPPLSHHCHHHYLHSQNGQDHQALFKVAEGREKGGE